MIDTRLAGTMSAHGMSTRSAATNGSFGEKTLYKRRQTPRRQQHVAEANQLRAIDGRVDRHARQPLGRLLFERVIDGVGNVGALLAKQQQVDEAVLERRAAVLDRLGGVDGIDRPHAQRPQSAIREVADAADEQRKQNVRTATENPPGTSQCSTTAAVSKNASTPVASSTSDVAKSTAFTVRRVF